MWISLHRGRQARRKLNLQDEAHAGGGETAGIRARQGAEAAGGGGADAAGGQDARADDERLISFDDVIIVRDWQEDVFFKGGKFLERN